MKKGSIYSIFLLSLMLLSMKVSAQITTGLFGGDWVASGHANLSNTTDKWVKIAELTLNGPYNRAGVTIDFYPKDAAHGDAHEQLSVHFRNESPQNAADRISRSTYDLSLIHFTGQRHTVKDAKAILTAGSGIADNKIAVWVQMGYSWIANIPIEIRKYGVCTVQTTNQPYYTNRTDSGETFSVNTRYSFKGKLFEMDGQIKAEKIVVDPDAWPDYVFKEGYNLKSLQEVENFIKSNGHLPNIAPADTFLTHGVSLGEMDVKLLEKIEELTLYTIEQEKKIKEQQALLEEVLRRLRKLEQ